jgi:mono/diheme cytochrome c family protein
MGGALVQADTHPAADYNQLVEQLYISYFGRPADPGGLANFSAQLSALGAPVDIQQLNAAYGANSSLRALIDSFGDSDESKALYSGDNNAFVNAIYANVLSRAPDADGQAFWVTALNNGGLTRANASLSIMAGALVNQSAQGQQDGQLVRNRVTVGANFTNALDTQTEISAYAGNQAAATARSMLSTIMANTDPASFGQTIDATIATLIANAAPQAPSYATVRAILNARCISCHSGGNAQAGVRLDNDAVVHALAQNIYTQVVVTRAMPFGNATGMTEDERNTIKAWFNAGAPQ